ncbi:hypothetical protein ABEB36_015165 [Hypothenemus hampei]|uniref:Uncharacterized protein n=1 Tax=Hypothenemus hampei TaxID=57062 RepID=A0ABD1E0L1_HYPHA
MNEEHCLDQVTVYFPIRRHSYLECDTDMSLIDYKIYTEVPEDWREVIRNCRMKPSPFNIIDCGREVEFLNWTQHLSGFYLTKYQFPTHSLKILQIKNEELNVLFKNTFYGKFTPASLTETTTDQNTSVAKEFYQNLTRSEETKKKGLTRKNKEYNEEDGDGYISDEL